ncbi:Disease resistance protein family [Quillaja saponaria]|uniref:Disease resistance protein family n=1 Tax=Quillaja saponaria TaxID=32244 RepID=A0AAD7VKE9_QUISA|nr:Disease resistance protein family [Quillaja saponaria]
MAPEVFSRLDKLEDLYMRNCHINNFCHGDLSGLHFLNSLDIHIQDVGLLPGQLSFEKLRRYKILIGDVWNWSGKFDFLRTLKLKLKKNINRVAGIKMLLKTVEELYLEELKSVKSILHELNEEGFPHLKLLDIQNNSDIQYIVDSNKWIQPPVTFPELESLVLHKLVNLEKIWQGPIKTALFHKLRLIKVEHCDRLKSLFSFSMVEGLSQLREIDVSQCVFMEEIVNGKEINDRNMSAPSDEISFPELRSLILQQLPMLTNFYNIGNKNSFSSQLEQEQREPDTKSKEIIITEDELVVPLFGNKVTFPNLESIRLISINLVKIWDEKFLATTYFQNLSSLIIVECEKIEYLFSSTMAKSFEELKYVEISKCKMMEEILQLDSGHFSNEVVFPKLETLRISKMDKLSRIWHDHDFAPKSFDKLKTVEIRRCHNLVTVFPSYQPEIFQNLETLEVDSCNSLEEIFYLQGLNPREIQEDFIPQLKVLILCSLRSLKHVSSNNENSHGIFKFPNLSVVKITGCTRLRHVFTASVAKDLSKLEKLEIQSCSSLEEIVEEEDGEQRVEFDFPQLTSMEVSYSRRLRSFYAGEYILKCPQLKRLEVNQCPKEAIFTFQQVCNESRRQQPFFSLEKVIPNLEELTLDEDQSETVIKHGNSRKGLFPNLKLLKLPYFKGSLSCSWFLHQMPHLEELVLESEISNKKILFCEVTDDKESETMKTIELPKKLTSSGIRGLKYIFFEEGSQTELVDLVIQKLEHLKVLHCHYLIKLAQCSVSFAHLKYLEIDRCDELRSLVTSSTANSLVQLTSLKISACKMIENIVADEDEAECDRPIIFQKLELLELDRLHCLTSFYSGNRGLRFQSLKSMFAIQCPRMETFTRGDLIDTPRLGRVYVQRNEDDWFWESDLNTTIHKVFIDLVAFHGIEYLRLSEYPMLKDKWDSQGPLKLFKLKRLWLDEREFVSSAISSTLLQSLNNLEKIFVDDCESLVQVIDMQGLGIDGHVGLLPRLKDLRLTNLKRLERIWSKDPQGILDLKNLSSLTISGCHSLRNLFTSSMFSGLLGLRKMEITDCKEMEEIICTKAISQDDHAAASTGSKIMFPQLNLIILMDLPNLTCFYSGDNTLQCPSLSCICMGTCPQMRTFSIGNISNTKITLPSLEELELGFNDDPSPSMSKIIWDLQLPEHSYSNIKFINMFGSKLSVYILLGHIPMGLIWRFGNLEQLHLSYLNVEELNVYEGSDGKEELVRNVLAKLMKLNLSGLFQCRTSLLSIGAASFENLTILLVSRCHALLSVVNSSVATTLVRLTYLKVK